LLIIFLQKTIFHNHRLTAISASLKDEYEASKWVLAFNSLSNGCPVNLGGVAPEG